MAEFKKENQEVKYKVIEGEIFLSGDSLLELTGLVRKERENDDEEIPDDFMEQITKIVMSDINLVEQGMPCDSEIIKEDDDEEKDIDNI